MVKFDINTAKVDVESNGNKYYKIPIGTTIHRGAINSVLDSDRPPFFGFFSRDVEQYGTVFDYIFNQDVKLLAIMEMDKNSDFYTSAPGNIQEILKKNFGYEKPIIRRSTPKSDRSIMQYLCALINRGETKYKQYSGYAMNGKYYSDIESKSEFHAELAVCAGSQEGGRFPFKDTTTYDDVTGSGMKSKKTTGNAPRVDDKKQLRHNTDDSPNKNKFVGNLGFGGDSDSDSDQESEQVPTKLVFGGNSRIRFKKKGKQTKRKGKRTKKVVIKYKKTRAKRRRGGGKKTVSFKSCKTDADCWLSEPECDTKNKICVRKKVFHK